MVEVIGVGINRASGKQPLCELLLEAPIVLRLPRHICSAGSQRPYQKPNELGENILNRMNKNIFGLHEMAVPGPTAAQKAVDAVGNWSRSLLSGIAQLGIARHQLEVAMQTRFQEKADE